MHDFLFVLEQTLGHVAHGRNLERVLAAELDVEATCFHLDYEARGWWRLPGLRNWSFRASWTARRCLERRVAERRPSAIFIHTQVASLLASGVMRRVPTIVSLDATPANFDQVGAAYSHRTSHPVLEATKKAINRRSLVAAAGIVTWCEWAAESLRQDYAIPADRIRVIPPGVDLELFKPLERAPRHLPRVLFVGGNLERKGGLDLLAAMPLLGQNVELDLVTTSAVPAGPHGIHVRVHRDLKPQSPELVRLFREADIFVLPTRGDCLPQVLAEGMACGLPLVATSVGAIPELVRHGVNGLLVSAGSPRDLAQALAALVGDAARRNAMGRAGLEIAQREHDMVRNNRSILDFMRAVSTARLASGVAA